jgi:hypothetical protein
MTKSKYYYDYQRNCGCETCDCRRKNLVETASETAETAVETAESVGIPSYYIGNNGYEARKVIAGFDLSYNVGTATTYLLRCGKKKEQGMSDKDKHIDDINKAINHLKFELERLNNE